MTDDQRLQVAIDVLREQLLASRMARELDSNEGWKGKLLSRRVILTRAVEMLEEIRNDRR